MRVAVGIVRSDSYKSTVLFGDPIHTKKEDGRTILVFENTSVVLMESVSRAYNAYLFRGSGSLSIPSVHPPVNLLVHAKNKTQKRKLLETLNWMIQHDQIPHTYSDLFWMKIASLINSRSYGPRHLKQLIVKEADQ